MATLRERWTQIFTFLSRAVTVLLGVGLLLALFSSAPQKKITLEAGTEGGLFDVMAKQLADELRPHGIDVTIVNRPDSLKIIDDIVDPKSPVEAGFVASDAPLTYYDKVSQVGTVMIAPVYLVTHVESEVRDISDFANRSISLYPVGSAAWAACDYILESYDVDIIDANSQYGNGKTIVKNIAERVTDVGCFIDVPSGVSSEYADTILAELANPNLRFIPIPQAQALQARRDFLRPLTVPSGAFNVYPPRPAADVPTTGASITFIAKNSLARELVVMIANALSQDYRGSTVANQAGELPAVNYMNLPVFDKARDVYSGGLPWMYERFSFGTAAFIDKFINEYGIALTLLFLFLSTVSVFGLPLPYDWVVGSRPRRTRMIIESIERRTQQTGQISRRDQRKLAMIEKWLQKQSFGIDGLEAQLRDVRSGLAPRQDSQH
ncbi:MAG: hypothetical protein KJS66_08970 [Acidobacteria bacterium]|nr:hypothetical protein [Acidobacteriota bacterium]